MTTNIVIDPYSSLTWPIEDIAMSFPNVRETPCCEEQPCERCNFTNRIATRRFIELRIGELRATADGLEALLGQIPTRLDTKAEEALWSLAQSIRG